MATQNITKLTTISVLAVGTFILVLIQFGIKNLCFQTSPVRHVEMRFEDWIEIGRKSQLLSKLSINFSNKNSTASNFLNLIEGKTKELFVNVYKDLQKVKTHVRSTKARKYLMHAFSKMSKIIQMADIKPRELTRKVFLSKHICPEEYKGTKYGYPFYEKGFEATSCTYSTPLEELITAVMLFEFDDVAKLKSLMGISRYNSRLRVLIGTYENFKAKDVLNSSTVTIFTFPEEFSQGKIWNYLIGKVGTEYTLIANNITTFNNDMRLERLIREIEILNVKVAGGATRDQNGHWKLGCFQTVYKNFTLVYQKGYDESLHECIFCDYIDAPFVTRTDTLKEYELFDGLNRISVFNDFFLRLAQNNHESIVCPDSMFNVFRETLSKDPTNWSNLANKWQLYRMKFGDEFDIYFSCGKWKRPCRPGKGHMKPPCCLKDLSDTVSFVMKLCKEKNIICELRCGTMLSAVKLHKVFPWEVDADLTILTANRTALIELKGQINKFYSLKIKSNSCVQIESRHNTVEIWNQSTMDSEKLLNNGTKPTFAFFNGHWFAVPRNPGLHARNRYGPEIYQHAQHWSTLGKKSSWMEYKTNKFVPCMVPNQQNCLDLYNADGNLPYELPVP